MAQQKRGDEVRTKDPRRFQHTVVSNVVPADRAFYERGLHFSCDHCSACCRIDPGYVFLRKKDTELLISALNTAYPEFIDRYCRWVPASGGLEQLSLIEKPNYDCIFWENGCSVYEARPLQCRTYPFWPTIFSYSRSWADSGAAMGCPGMGKGKLYTAEEIELILDQQKAAEPVITRERG
ncbi:zinc/iron-chelating domain-containing protein [Spirochaetia bacterium]|nr:zinc/iron-chelating domain-containing protein [Spirochaetia bacterium]